jgi:hypothetical protein
METAAKVTLEIVFIVTTIVGFALCSSLLSKVKSRKYVSDKIFLVVGGGIALIFSSCMLIVSLTYPVLQMR